MKVKIIKKIYTAYNEKVSIGSVYDVIVYRDNNGSVYINSDNNKLISIPKTSYEIICNRPVCIDTCELMEIGTNNYISHKHNTVIIEADDYFMECYFNVNGISKVEFTHFSKMRYEKTHILKNIKFIEYL